MHSTSDPSDISPPATAVDRPQGWGAVRGAPARLLQQFFEHTSDGVWQVDLEGRTVYANRKMGELLGCSASELSPRRASDFLWPEDRDRADAYHAKRARGESDVSEWRLRRADGSAVWVRISGIPVRDDSGAIVGSLGTFTDITSQKRAEHALREKEMLYRRHAQLLELAHDVILVRDFQDRVLLWNAAAEQVYGWTQSAALGCFASTLLRTEYPIPHERIMAELRTSGQWKGELVHHCRDGRRIVVDSRWAVQNSDDGEPAAILEIDRDITEQKLLNEELRRRESHLQAALDVSRTGTYEWNVVTGEGKSDPSLERLFGVPAGTSMDSFASFLQYVHPEDRPSLIAVCEQCAREGIGLSAEYRIVRPDGAVRWIHARGEIARDRGEGQKVMIGACIDITELRSAQEQLRANHRQQRTVLENLPVGVFHLDRERRIIYGNPMAYRIWAGDAEIRQPDWRRVTARWHDSGQAIGAHDWASAQAIESGKPVLNQVLDFDCFDGKRRTVLNSAVPLFDERGTVDGAVVFLLDITASARMQAVVRESETRLRSIFQTAAVGIAVCGAEGSWLEVNDTMCRLTGYPREELLHTRWMDLTHPDDRGRNLEQFEQLRAGASRHISTDKRYVRRDGSTVWVNVTISLLNADSAVAGESPRYLCVAADISERRAAELQTRESKERLVAALAASHTGTFIWDMRSNQLQWDDELNRLFDVQPGESITQLEQFIGRVYPPDREKVLAACARCVSDGVGFHEEFRIYLSDGSLRWLEDKGSIVRDAEGRPEYMAGACVDITPRKLADEAAALSRERFAFVREASGVGFWFCDLPFSRLDWDARVKAHFGLPPDAEVTIELFYNCLHPEDRTRTRAAIERAIAENLRYDVEYRTVGPDGITRWLRAIGGPHFNEAGKAVSFDGITIDITETVQARELLESRGEKLEQMVSDRTASLRETVAELEKFSYSISHDLRAPLRAMQSFALILQEECEQALPEPGRDYLRRIVVAANRMDRLIQDVLSYSRMARTEVHLTTVDLSRLVRGILDTYPQFHDNSAVIAVEDPLPSVRANEAALTQCISNLLNNALRFVRPGVPPEIRIRSQRTADAVRLLVSDNGIGIEPRHHERIFALFEQVDTTYGGTGLGLAIVRKAAEKMGAKVGVESTPGEGSTFWIEFPPSSSAP